MSPGNSPDDGPGGVLQTAERRAGRLGGGALALFGLTGSAPILQEGITGPRIAAAALSVAPTALVLRLLACPHPRPARPL